ncbi:MAG: hypothetical protein AAFR61_02465 [Bacteroidota bacterium]
MNRRYLIFYILCFISAPVLFGQKAQHMGYEINSAFEEREPIPSPDGQSLYFWRREMPANTAGLLDPGDIWYSSRDYFGRWKAATRMRVPLNSKGHDFVWHVSPNRDTLWVMQVPPGVREGGIAYSVRDRSGNWSPPEPAHIRGFTYQGQYKDYFMGPNRILMLPNEGTESYGGTDIYVCFPLNDTAWSTPVNLGPVINTFGDEDAPYLTPDGKTLYFNSTGHGGLGDHDIFVSQRLDDTWRNWSRPENVGAPINTDGYDFDFYMSANGKSLFWCSDQASNGSNDIFYMDLESCELDVYPEGNHTLCEGQSLMLEGGFTVGNKIDYQWLKNGFPIRGATGRVLRVATSGNYQLVRIKPGCVDTSNVQEVNFVPAPEPLIKAPSSVLCLDDSLQLLADARKVNGYQWVKNGLDIPGATRPRFSVDAPGRYSVKVANGSCITESAPVNLRRFNPPGIYTEADTVNGLLPVLPRWLWTNKMPKAKGKQYTRDLTATGRGDVYVLSTYERNGKFFDQVDGFFKEGLNRLSFKLPRNWKAEEQFIAADNQGNLVIANNESYLVKYRSDGRMMWQKDVSRQKISGLAVDPLGYVYTMGRFKEETIVSGKRLAATNRGGLFLAKHSPRGELMWVKSFSVDWFKYDFGNALHVDGKGNVYLAGGYKLIADFGDITLRASLSGDNYFLVKFDTKGELKWAKKMSTPKPKNRIRSHDVHTDKLGNTFLALNRTIWRYDANGVRRWQGPMVTPSGANTLKTRIHSHDLDLYITGFTDKGGVFVSKLNRLNRQVIIWQDKGAANSELDLPVIGSDESGAILIAGVSKGSSYPGAQLSLTSNSPGFLMKYGHPNIRSDREPLSLCEGKSVRLLTQVSAGLRYQWVFNGNDVPGANQPYLEVSNPGTYQVRAFADQCERISEPQQVTECGDDPMATPPITATTSDLPPPPAPSPRVEPEIVARDEAPPSEVKTNASGVPTRLRRRRIKTQEEIIITNREATITLWDHAAMDLDTVSLNVNGDWLVENYGLKKARKSFKYTFQPGDNFIMLYAHNLGTTPPNTAAVMVDDGINTKTLILRSNLRNCGMLKVRVE